MKYSANIKFLKADEGGRSNPPCRGYKPQVKLENCIHTSCVITPQDDSVEIMELGKRIDVNIEFLFEDVYDEQIRKLKNIELYEGSRLVGAGHILK